ncbi:MAG: hypothetical protein Q9191_008407, partial [Dirinaria sp. TL-2023a]
MELSDPVAPSSSPATNDATNRRRSGRARQQPVLYQPDPTIPKSSSASAKRKRTELRGGDVDGDDDVSESESDPAVSESDPDEEELRDRRKKAKKAPSKPAVKKPKTLKTTKLAVRPATNGVTKPVKAKKPRARPSAVAALDEGGLY